MRATTGACRCGQRSARVHGRYVRRLRDVAVGGLGVVIELCVRRFRCENPDCTAVTFAEQIAGLTTPHSRYSPLLRGVLTRVGLAPRPCPVMASPARTSSRIRLLGVVGRDVRSLPCWTRAWSWAGGRSCVVWMSVHGWRGQGGRG
ncbi:transposase family protein [Streptomyces sp. NBC_01614]|uniref:transposase family protein n=1 Tax=Streptomyces sp. NBC_01614 TaxID=2975897 RepID=UPI003864D025